MSMSTMLIIAGIVFATYLYFASNGNDRKILKHLLEAIVEDHNNPIVLPDSNGKYLVIFRKGIFQTHTPTVNIDDEHIDKKQYVRVCMGKVTKGDEEGKEFFAIIGVRLMVNGSDEPVQIQGDDENHFFFLLTSEQLHQGFQLQALDGDTWSPLKLRSSKM